MKDLQKVQIIVFRKTASLEFLLLKTAPRKGTSIWQAVTGGVEDYDDSLKAAAIRELSEELNIQAATHELMGPFYDFEFITNRSGFKGTFAKEFCFGLEVKKKFKVVLSDEHVEYQWLKFNEAIEKVSYESSKHILEKLHSIIIDKK